MSIQYDFTEHDTIRIECGFEVIEVPLPAPLLLGDAGSGDADDDTPTVAASPAVSPSPSTSGGARGDVIASGPQQGPSARPKPITRAMGLISNKRVDFDWTQVDLPVPMLSLDGHADMTQDELARFLSKGAVETFTGNTGNTLKILNVGVTPWIGTTPKQLENLRSIVKERSIDVDAVRLFRLPDIN